MPLESAQALMQFFARLLIFYVVQILLSFLLPFIGRPNKIYKYIYWLYFYMVLALEFIVIISIYFAIVIKTNSNF